MPPANDHEHLGRLLLRAQRLYADRALRKLHARGHRELGVAHLTLLPHFDLDGVRPSALAERAGMTKQAAGQLVSDLQTAGYLRRETDPDDRRASVLVFTAQGRRLWADARAVKVEIDDELARLVGARGLAQLKQLLSALLAAE